MDLTTGKLTPYHLSRECIFRDERTSSVYMGSYVKGGRPPTPALSRESLSALTENGEAFWITQPDALEGRVTRMKR